MQEKLYAVYMMTNPAHTVLYTGFTSDLPKRAFEHKEKLVKGFTKKYNCVKLVWFETRAKYDAVLAREKEIKGWKRFKKERLINTINPNWDDLYDTIT